MSGPARARSVVSSVACLAVFVAAVLLWAVGSPREEVVSLGDGSGRGFPEGATVGTAQLCAFLVLVFAASVAATLVLWRRHPGLRRATGSVILICWGGVGSALVATLCGPVASWALGPDPGVAAGAVVQLAPSVGALFRGPILAGVVGPDWSSLPVALGWAVPGAAAAAITTAVCAWLSPWEDLVAPGEGMVSAPREA